MIPITCPTCGRKGTIPNERLNTRMHCKKCDAVFHMDKSGKVMLGEPGAAKPAKGGPPGKSTGAKTAKAPPKKRQTDSEGSGLSEMLAMVPLWAKVAVLLGVLAVGVIASGVLTPPPTDPTLNYSKYKNDIESRFLFAAHMFCDNNAGEIRKVTTGESQKDVQAWLDLVRPMFKFDGPEGVGKRCEVQAIKVTGDGASAATAEWAAHIIPPLPYTGPEVEALKATKKAKEPLTPGYDTAGLFDLPMYWVKKGDKWELDATKTLTEAKAKIKPAA